MGVKNELGFCKMGEMILVDSFGIRIIYEWLIDFGVGCIVYMDVIGIDI